MQKKLPIGIQTFSQIRKEHYIYVDKTALAVQLAEHYKYVFLSRPRRFGKSLFVDTLKEMFEGNRELFAGLAAERSYDWSQRFPVVKISFAGSFRTPENLCASILALLESNEQRLGVLCENALPTLRFAELLHKVYEKYKQPVVILIDEYDKPILDNIDDPAMALEAREQLREFYATIKDHDAHIRFAFLTGVSRFSKVSIFSGLNNIESISLNPQFGTICGYTQQELEENFAAYLDGVEPERLQCWYDGYNFLAENVYNPFDILLFFRNNKEFKNYWFQTGTPTSLIKLIRAQHFFLPELTAITAGDALLNSFDIDHIDLVTMLFQTGYLTIKEELKIGEMVQYKLGLPNLEVSAALNDSLLDLFIENRSGKKSVQVDFYTALYLSEPAKFQTALTALFAAIPYHHYTRNDIARYEGFYASVIYAWLASSQLPVVVEDCTNKGRIDMSIVMEQAVYLIEFKVDQPGEEALFQIKKKNYGQKFSGLGKDIFLIGIAFDSQKRNVSEFFWEKA